MFAGNRGNQIIGLRAAQGRTVGCPVITGLWWPQHPGEWEETCAALRLPPPTRGPFSICMNHWLSSAATAPYLPPCTFCLGVSWLMSSWDCIALYQTPLALRILWMRTPWQPRRKGLGRKWRERISTGANLHFGRENGRFHIFIARAAWQIHRWMHIVARTNWYNLNSAICYSGIAWLRLKRK